MEKVEAEKLKEEFFKAPFMWLYVNNRHMIDSFIDWMYNNEYRIINEQDDS